MYVYNKYIQYVHWGDVNKLASLEVWWQGSNIQHCTQLTFQGLKQQITTNQNNFINNLNVKHNMREGKIDTQAREVIGFCDNLSRLVSLYFLCFDWLLLEVVHGGSTM